VCVVCVCVCVCVCGVTALVHVLVSAGVADKSNALSIGMLLLLIVETGWRLLVDIHTKFGKSRSGSLKQ